MNDVGIAGEVDRVETAITAVNSALNPSLWTAARRTPAAAQVVSEAVRVMIELYRERDALRSNAEHDGLL